ncbi:MAG: c-type cytochrome [Nitrospinota bacterium]
MKTWRNVILFTLVLIGFFIYVSTLLTQISGSTGAKAVSGEITPEAGEALFWGKGKCYTCHSIGARGSAVRGPNLGVAEKFPEPVAVRAAKRRAGTSATGYIVESIYDPNAFVVPGFSKGLMKPINRPPIALSDEEITAVITYLLSQGGQEVDANLVGQINKDQQPFRVAAAQELPEAGPTLKIPEGDPETGYEVFQRLECYECHKIENFEFPVSEETAGVGPDLTGIGEIQTRVYLFESILSPNAVVVQGPGYTGNDGNSKMPQFHDVMTVSQLQDLVAFLSGLRADSASAQFEEEEDEEDDEDEKE